MLKRRKVVLIFGQTGSGKSYLAKRLLPEYNRVVVFDPLGEYFGGVVVHDFSEFKTVALEKHTGNFKIVCRMQQETEGERREEYEKIARAVWALGDTLLVLEEVEQYLNSMDRDSFINYLISFGRHRAISLVGIGRRPFDVPIKLRAQVNTVITFKQTEPNDLRHCANLGFNPDEVARLDYASHEYAVIGEPIDTLSAYTKARDGNEGELPENGGNVPVRDKAPAAGPDST